MELLLSLVLAAVPAAAAPSPAARPGRELRGRVLSEGRPVAGATVVAVPVESALEQARREARFTDAARELGLATSARDGAFSLRLASGPEELRLQASAPGHVAVIAEAPLGGAAPVEVRLERAASLAGTVLGAAGQPVAGATVTLWPRVEQPGATPVPVTGTTGPDGRFRFDGASERGNRLRVEAPGQAVVDLAALRAGALRQPVRLQRGRSLEGLVLRSDQRPAAGALVRLEGPVTLRWVEAGPNGAFRLDGLPQAPGGSLVAEAGEAGRARSALPASGSARLVLAPTATLRGRVLDGRTAQPVAGVRVGVVGPGGHAFARSAADGRFELPGLAPGRSTLTADEPRYAPWSLHQLDVPAGGALVRDVALAPAAVLVGRVLDEGGLPVADASGFLRRGGQQAGPLAFLRAVEPDFRTGPDGRFEAARLSRPGATSGCRCGTPTSRRERWAGWSSSPAARTPRSRSCCGAAWACAASSRMFAASRWPTPSCACRARSSSRAGAGAGLCSSAWPAWAPAARSSAAGRMGASTSAACRPATFRCRSARRATPRRRSTQSRWPSGRSRSRSCWRPGPPSAASCATRRARASRAARVVAREPGVRGPLAGARSEEPSAGDGAFLIEGLTPGRTYEVALMDFAAPGRRGAPVVAPAEGVELLAAGLGRIEGVALDAGSGLPLSDFEVSYEVRERGGRTIVRGGPRGGALAPGEKLEVHDEEGRFVLDGVPAGTWDVEASAPGYERSRAGAVTLEEGGQATGVEVRLRRGATLSGRVTEEGSGRPVADAEVNAEPQGGEPRFRFGDDEAGGARTGPDGRFELAGLAPGSYSVSAHASRLRRGHRVRAGQGRFGHGGAAAGAAAAASRAWSRAAASRSPAPASCCRRRARASAGRSARARSR